ncbi:putative FBD-associated F-box protein At1g05080 [Bidens hawaiensis]|uniref:putative FBD-associated F-box protein At1g05080 n=1 Tax=Bidens hawaiensis TaxID=980011 RepID=UPI0040494B6A
MERIHGRPKSAPQDFISRMPDDVVTNILDRLPLLDAVRTDVLSKTWRLLLLHLRGAITKFVLSDHKVVVEDEDIHHWISLLSRKRIKDLTLEIFIGTAPYKLPAHLFSCLELKHLTLNSCCFHPPPNFHGFPNLLSLDLYLHSEESSDSWEFISRCPLLENLKVDCDFYSSKIKLAEIAKLENLKILSLYLSDLDTMNNFRSSVAEGDAKWRFSTAFSSLQTLKLANVCLEDVCWSASTGRLQYTEQLQLRSVRFKYWNGSENEVCMLKYLLACSPFLKKIAIHHCSHNEITSDEKLKFPSKVLKLHQASPVVDIDIT